MCLLCVRLFVFRVSECNTCIMENKIKKNSIFNKHIFTYIHTYIYVYTHKPTLFQFIYIEKKLFSQKLY